MADLVATPDEGGQGAIDQRLKAKTCFGILGPAPFVLGLFEHHHKVSSRIRTLISAGTITYPAEVCQV